jgi:lysozyme
MMQASPKARALIEEFEGLRLTAYQDQRGIWTIGYGHTGPEVHAGLVWTQAQAEAALISDMQRTVLGVIKSLDVAIGQNQFDALVSFTFNVGVDAEQHSTLLRLVNSGHSVQAAEQFLRWDHVNGVENDGLKRRRKAERDLFLEGLV